MDGQRLAKTREERNFLSAAENGDKAWVETIIGHAKQTNTNLNGVGRVKELLGLKNKNGDTAFHLATNKGHQDVVNTLVAECPELLRSDKYSFSLLCKGKYDEAIIQILKTTTTDAPTVVIPIDDQHQEPISYTESKMVQSWYTLRCTLRDMQMSLEKLNRGEIELSSDRNTILHISSKFGDKKSAEDILKKHPSLLSERNLQGETPAYIAASEGHMDIVEMIIGYLKTKKYQDSSSAEAHMKELMTRSTDKDTALLAAVRNHYAGVVFTLMKEVHMLADDVNDFKESPLYLAAEKGYVAIVEHILERCERATLKGPYVKTALHAAALSGSSECMEHLLKRSKPDLLNAQDVLGWTPLHYAACFDNQDAARLLVTKDRSTGYHVNKDGATAIHIAASRGHYLIMEIIMEKCRGCWEITNSKGRNILHVAVEKQKKEVIDFILGHKLLTSLINQKDNDGNTPLHLLVASDLEMEGPLIKDARVNIHVLNNEKRTPLDMASSVDRREKFLQCPSQLARTSINPPDTCNLPPVQATVEGTWKVQPSPPGLFPEVKAKLERLNKIMENVILVATLVATASFAAAFAVPGGYDGKGMPILRRKPSFQAFFVTNALAFTSSISAIFLYIHSLMKRNFNADETTLIGKLTATTYSLVGMAMVAMAITFIIGLYVVLEPSLGLVIPLCFVSLLLLVPTLVFPKMFSEYFFKVAGPVIVYLFS